MNELTLDEAIKHCLEVAEQNETQADKIGGQLIGSAIDKYATDCRECAAEHRQLAEWLTDYKELKNSIGAVKLSDMKEVLELIREYKAENVTLREENKVLMQECDRLIREKGELLSKVSGGDVLRICQLEEQLDKAKRLLRAAVDDLKFESQCRNCKHLQTGLYNICNGCQGNEYEWRYADEAEKTVK